MMHLVPPSPFTLRQLECFVAVAQVGSIAAAAIALHASDSAVSDSISAMERSLGAVLFTRRRARGVTLTSDGHAILPMARALLLQAEELSSAVGRDPAALTGPVRVGAIPTLAAVVLPALIVEMAARHPDVRIEFTIADQEALAAAVAIGDLDAIIVFDIDIPPELARHELTRTHACLVVASDHPLASRETASLTEVADEPMVLLDIAPSRVHTLELMSTAGITPRIAHRTDNYELCRSLVGRGLGYSLLMRRRIDRKTWDGGTVVFIELDPPPREIRVIVAWGGARPARLAAVVDAATRVAPEHI